MKVSKRYGLAGKGRIVAVIFFIRVCHIIFRVRVVIAGALAVRVAIRGAIGDVVDVLFVQLIPRA